MSTTPTIADAIARLSPPQSYGDQLAVAMLRSYQRQLAELNAKILGARSDVMCSYLEDEQRCLQRVAEAVAAVALAYQKNQT
jgi:hypothetical protein